MTRSFQFPRFTVTGSFFLSLVFAILSSGPAGAISDDEDRLLRAGAERADGNGSRTDTIRGRHGVLGKGESPAVIGLLADKTLDEGEELVQALREMQPRSVFRDCKECPEMVVVPAGRFRMGDVNGGGESDEQPVHEVTIAYPFAVGRYEVMFAEWDACAADVGCTHRPGDQGWGRENRPVINVSWDDAQAYVRWLLRETGKPYRLLSEAEWEYVARAGTTTEYPWGDDIGTNEANCGGCSSRGGAIKRRHPWGVSIPTLLVCSIWWGTCGNGWRTVGTIATAGPRLMAALGRAGVVASAWCAAGPGAASMRRTCAPRTATGTAPASGNTRAGFGLPGRSPRES